MPSLGWGWDREDIELERRDRRRLKNAIGALQRRIDGDFRDLMEAGRLIAIGRPGDLSAEPQWIAADIWPALQNINWRSSAVGENRPHGSFFLAVRVSPVLKAPQAADLVGGHTLPEAFREFVLEDPEVAALAKEAIRLAPEFERLFAGAWCHVHGTREWPVAPSNDDPTSLGGWEEGPAAGFLAEPPPRAVGHAASALADRYRALLRLLRAGDVVARGLPAKASQPGEVPLSLWSHRSFHFDATTGDFLEVNPEARDPPRDWLVKRWSGLVLEQGRPLNRIATKDGGPTIRRRPKMDAVSDAIERAGIDLATSQLGPKPIADKIAADLTFKVSTQAQQEALAKMIGRLRRERERSR